ncbi:ABC transporter permease [Heyndrickxia oleronia]|jgi:ABC-2 type transport system permease protein|uniref:ABC transporter permease n=1 Tax=Heyndrickxia oleronia TaxID=38875 RepID=UPI00243033F3|nr:ABC transporter permease [Heyndrickxia oleronia]MCI1591130.1 ABC transporter permease [Heyndrickxia oleronia]MCI1614644.1 ABC transporter permease [Heyndrickxia oleronia]MCI1745519.1 ABC transporter permease [Heyndrickxia oleronia]MCI1762522.1 ABC transporter permease [Heyndrickxia oleronia]
MKIPNNFEVKSPTFGVVNSVFIGRSLRHSLRNTESLIMAIALPIILMLLFTYVFGGAIDPSGEYVTYVVPGIILLCAGFGSSSTAVDVATDMTNGIIDRFRTMPISSIHVITGHVIASLVRNLVATGIVICVALLVGFQPSANLLEWLGAIGIITLFILTFTWLFAAIGLVATSPTAASSYGFALLFLPYLSSAFVPTDTMPSWLQGVAAHQPITPVIETIRGLLTQTPIHHYAWWAIGWCLLILIGSYIWCNWMFQRKTGRR